MIKGSRALANRFSLVSQALEKFKIPSALGLRHLSL